MSNYLYELPTTGAISFSSFYNDPDGSYISCIAQVTECRATLRACLKEAKRFNDSEKDYLQLVKILDEYIPQLTGIINCIDHDELLLKTTPTFTWRSTLSSTIFHSSPRLTFPSISAELAFSLLTYGFCLSNLARCVVVSLGSYEYDRAIMDAELKAKDERLAFAVSLLCKVAGIFEYVGKEVLSRWEHERQTMKEDCPNPPDLSREVVIALSKMTLAEAQTLALRKLLSKSAYDSTLTPGPPLPKSHPSPVLIAKLHLECASLYSSARSLAKTPGASKPKLKFNPLGGKDKDKETENVEEISPELKRYLADESAYHAAMGRKWLGVDAGENGGADKAGPAVGFLTWAQKELEELKDGGKSRLGVSLDREKEIRERRKNGVLRQLASVNVFLKHYRNMNDTLAFQPVPPQSDLQSMIPAGRLAVTMKPYQLPAPAFGPGSSGYVSQQIDGLNLIDKAESDVHSPPSGNSYAGAGSYF